MYIISIYKWLYSAITSLIMDGTLCKVEWLEDEKLMKSRPRSKWFMVTRVFVKETNVSVRNINK